ncbi:MAG: DedA family protein [Gemmataceae bacterium]
MEDFFNQTWEMLRDIILNFTNPEEWKKTLGRPGVYWSAVATLAVIIFAETGLLAGFFLPGDSLLVTVGIIARTAEWNILYLMIALSLAAIIGDTVGYAIGAKAGPAIFNRPNSRFFKRDHLLKAKAFFDQHGGKTIIFARFMPFARTFAPVVAGAARMEYRTFVAYNIVGGILWIVSMLLFGYTAKDWLEPILKGIFGPEFRLEKKIDILAGVIIVLSLAPMVVMKLLERRKGATPPPTAPATEPVPAP